MAIKVTSIQTPEEAMTERGERTANHGQVVVEFEDGAKVVVDEDIYELVRRLAKAPKAKAKAKRK
jgi:hypothetical protein